MKQGKGLLWRNTVYYTPPACHRVSAIRFISGP
jgi:hypothetical protein